jgi:hypothetical protein
MDNQEFLGIQITSSTKILSAVRNPYTRIVSDLFFFGLINKDTPHEQVYDIIQNKFLKGKFDNHELPQHIFVTKKDGSLIDNLILLRTETLTKDMHNLGYDDFERSDLVNSHVSSKMYHQYLNAKSVQLINSVYHKDFILFQYEMNLKHQGYPIQPVLPTKHQRLIRNAYKLLHSGRLYSLAIYYIGSNVCELLLRNLTGEHYMESECTISIEDMTTGNVQDYVVKCPVSGVPRRLTTDVVLEAYVPPAQSIPANLFFLSNSLHIPSELEYNRILSVVDHYPECTSYVYDLPLRQSFLRSKDMFDSYNRLLFEPIREKLFLACVLYTYGGHLVDNSVPANIVWCGCPKSPLLGEYLHVMKKHIQSRTLSAFPRFVSDCEEDCAVIADPTMFATKSLSNKRFAIFVCPSPCDIQIRFANYSNLLHISCETVPMQIDMRIVNLVTCCESMRTISLTNTESYRLL